MAEGRALRKCLHPFTSTRCVYQDGLDKAMHPPSWSSDGGYTSTASIPLPWTETRSPLQECEGVCAHYCASLELRVCTSECMRKEQRSLKSQSLFLHHTPMLQAPVQCTNKKGQRKADVQARYPGTMQTVLQTCQPNPRLHRRSNLFITSSATTQQALLHPSIAFNGKAIVAPSLCKPFSIHLSLQQRGNRHTSSSDSL